MVKLPNLWPSWLYTLRDPLDRWTAIDKVAHLFGTAFVYDHLGLIGAVTAALLVEVIEAARWVDLSVNDRHGILSGAVAWPWLCDRASLKDLMADALGIGLAIAVSFLRGLV